MIPYVVSVDVAVTVMHVLLFVLHVCVLRECEGVRVMAMLVWGTGDVWFRRVRIWVVQVLSSACDVLEMSVVRSVGGVCDMCMCLARDGVRGLGLGFTNPGGTGGKWDMYLCFGCNGVGGGVGGLIGQGSGRVSVVSLDSFC